MNIIRSLMFKEKSYLAIIPARGGSKRLPRKNILELKGKPLIHWSINSALKCKYIDNVVLTSDDEEILRIGSQLNCNILKRPPEFSSDTATTFEAIKHAIENSTIYDYIVLLQPTSPLRTYKHIEEAIELLEEKEADAIISVCEMEHSPLWSNCLPSNNSLESFLRKDTINKRSQDLEKYFRLNGAIYICKTDKLLENKGFFLSKNIFAYIMNKESSVDIDEEIDFHLASLYLSKNINNEFN